MRRFSSPLANRNIRMDSYDIVRMFRPPSAIPLDLPTFVFDCRRSAGATYRFALKLDYVKNFQVGPPAAYDAAIRFMSTMNSLKTIP
jgi:hypothetical protein